MDNYLIYPLNVGTLTIEKSRLAHNLGTGQIIDVPVFAWYVTDGNRKILVDTGGLVPTADHNPFAPYEVAEEQRIENALGRIGVKCSDIECVVLTHLHWDHAHNNQLFNNAAFYVQKKELQYAAAPIPIHKGAYELEVIFAADYDHIVDGDYDLGRGIQLVSTPGHSPGSMSVIVDTAGGRYAIVGDLVAFMDCWEASPKIPNGFLTDFVATYESFDKLERLADHVLCAHDKRFLQHEHFPY